VTVKTQGVLLGRAPVNHNAYDERVLFLTQDYGKILCYSFGSRSPKSKRGQILASFHWVEIFLDLDQGQYELKSLTVTEKNTLMDVYETSQFFLKALTYLREKLPLSEPNPEVYEFLKWASVPIVDFKESFLIRSLEVLLTLGLLKLEGLYPLEDFRFLKTRNLTDLFYERFETSKSFHDLVGQVLGSYEERDLSQLLVAAKKTLHSQI
jgi:recombinational DNA repair protein (RecF pathway)